MKEQKSLDEQCEAAELAYENDYYPCDNGWVKAIRSNLVRPLMYRSQGAACLLWMIALRAWRGPGMNGYGCGPGEAFIGDWHKLGFTHKGYRVAKDLLAELGYCSFKSTNRGTLAKLLNPYIFDINIDESGGRGKQGANEGQTEGKQGANRGQTEGKQGASEGQTRGKRGANEGQLTRSEEVKNSKTSRSEEAKTTNNTAGAGSSGGLPPSGVGEPEGTPDTGASDTETEDTTLSETEDTTLPETEDQDVKAEDATPPAAEAVLPDNDEDMTPDQKAVLLSNNFPRYVKAVAKLNYVPIFTRSTLDEAINFFRRNTDYTWWDVAAILALGIKNGRIHPPVKEGVDPYWFSRTYAHKPNMVFDRVKSGKHTDDLILAVIQAEGKYAIDNEHDFDWFEKLVKSEYAWVIKTTAKAKAKA